VSVANYLGRCHVQADLPSLPSLVHNSPKIFVFISANTFVFAYYIVGLYSLLLRPFRSCTARLFNL
jgi:hypothetical protein